MAIEYAPDRHGIVAPCGGCVTGTPIRLRRGTKWRLDGHDGDVVVIVRSYRTEIDGLFEYRVQILKTGRRIFVYGDRLAPR